MSVDAVLEKAGSSRKRKRSRSNEPYNKPYTKEQQDWIRYQREDLSHGWEEIKENFYVKFPDVQRRRNSAAAFSSRFYRGNRVPKLDENSQPVIDTNGNFVMMQANVKDRVKGDWPSRLVDLHPELVLSYGWVTEEGKKEANEILEILDGRRENTGNVSKSEFTL
jgi:hypothetical protein